MRSTEIPSESNFVIGFGYAQKLLAKIAVQVFALYFDVLVILIVICNKT